MSESMTFEERCKRRWEYRVKCREFLREQEKKHKGVAN